MIISKGNFEKKILLGDFKEVNSPMFSLLQTLLLNSILNARLKICVVGR